MSDTFDAILVDETKVRRLIPSCADYLFAYASPPGKCYTQYCTLQLINQSHDMCTAP